MPLEIVNERLYLDRTVQVWHRPPTLPADADAIDIDLVGFCRRCREPLYLIESTTNPEKGTYYLRSLALAAGIRALLVLHGDGVIHSWRVISPSWSDWTTSPLEEFLLWLRDRHKAEKHNRDGSAQGGSGGNGVGRVTTTPARKG